MRKILSSILLVAFFFTGIFPVMAALENDLTVTPSSKVPQPTSAIAYPTGDDFVKLKSLIDATFSKKTSSQYNCIANNTLCPNYRYTSIVEKAIKLIILKTYTGNEDFYAALFQSSTYYSSYGDEGLGDTTFPPISSILAHIPKGTSFSDWRTLNFGRSLGGGLLDASFGVDFSENSNTNSMLGALEQKIQELKRTNCQRSQGKDCHNIPLSNIYLPTPEELSVESIYLNRTLVKIATLAHEYEYIVSRDPQDTLILNPSLPQENIVALDPSLTSGTGTYMGFMDDGLFGTIPGITYVDALQNCMGTATMYPTSSTHCTWNDIEIYSRSPGVTSDISSSRTTYTLRYKKDIYTLEEAQAKLEERENRGVNTTISSRDRSTLSLPCQSTTDASIRSECSTIVALARDVQSALGAYYADTETYPNVIEKLDTMYIPKPDVLEKFKQNFEYTNISTPQEPNFEIRYIGKIGENSTVTTPSLFPGESSLKRDYKALLSGATVPDIPSIFSHIPSDSMVLYVRNPTNLLQILDQKNTTSSRIIGVDTSESIRKFLMTFFELENYDQIQSHLKNEMAIIMNNLDATAPDIVIVLSEADRAALSPTAHARVVGSKDGYIFIANSKESLERFTGLIVEKSMKNAPDFQYVWWKKSEKIRDVLLYVGDEYFEKMITLETYITHYRKYRDYARLSALQELVWAYTDAFGASPTSLSEMTALGLSSLTGTVLDEYTIVDGLVVHKNIGSLKSLKTIPEAKYTLESITRTELEDYTSNVLKYRDIWRASLDPMGIVLNRYGDGIEIDFFMTPVPHFDDSDLRDIQEMFSLATKDTLAFVTNPRIRMGLASAVFGFDVTKFREWIASAEDLQSGFDEFNKEVLDGKNIFDYIGGEFAFSLGGIDPDILDGWNVEKVDIYASIQVKSEEKGKELIDIIRTKFLSEFQNISNNDSKLIKGFLAKPMIEEYNARKIYYIEGLPIPLVGKIGFAYTFIDDFFIIGLNRSTIRKIIDIADTSDIRKGKIVESDSFQKNTIFATFFDSEELHIQLHRFYEKNKLSVVRYMKNFHITDSSKNSTFLKVLMGHYRTEERKRRLGKVGAPFDYILGALHITGNEEKLLVRIDKQKLTTLTGVTLQIWDNLRTEADFPQDILSAEGISLDTLLSYKNLDDFASFVIVSHLDTLFESPDSLFQNITLGLSLGDDEIGFRLRMFRNMDTAQSGRDPMSRDMVFILSGVIGLLVFGGLIVFLISRKRRGDISGGGVPVSLGASFGTSTPAPVTSGEFTTVSTPEVITPAPVVPPPAPVTPDVPPVPAVPLVPDAPVVPTVNETLVVNPGDTFPEESSPIVIPTESSSTDIQK